MSLFSTSKLLSPCKTNSFEKTGYRRTDKYEFTGPPLPGVQISYGGLHEAFKTFS